MSWRFVANRLTRLQAMGIFDNPKAKAIDVKALVKPGAVSVIDLSGTRSSTTS